MLNGFDVEKLLDSKLINHGVVFNAPVLKKQDIKVDISSSISVNPIIINNEPGGWLVAEFQDEIQQDVEKYLSFIDSIAHIVESLLGDLYLESELNTRCLYLIGGK